MIKHIINLGQVQKVLLEYVNEVVLSQNPSIYTLIFNPMSLSYVRIYKQSLL